MQLSYERTEVLNTV